MADATTEGHVSVAAVVVDSTVLYSDPRLSRAHFRVIRSYAARGEFKLVIPEVVVQEAAGLFETRSRQAYNVMRGPSSELEKLGLPTIAVGAVIAGSP